jgi:hypothetical protein
MNLITELLDDPGFAAELLRRPASAPLSLRDAAARLRIEPTDPGRWAGPPGEDFEPAGPELLDRAQLTRFPASALPEGEDEELPDVHHGAPLWLEARYLDQDRQEIAVFPNDDDAAQRVMLYAPGEFREDSVILEPVSAELQVAADGRRRLLGLFKRHPSCPTGFYQPDGKFFCPPVHCPKGGACTPRKRAGASGVNYYCRCKH